MRFDHAVTVVVNGTIERIVSHENSIVFRESVYPVHRLALYFIKHFYRFAVGIDNRYRLISLRNQSVSAVKNRDMLILIAYFFRLFRSVVHLPEARFVFYKKAVIAHSRRHLLKLFLKQHLAIHGYHSPLAVLSLFERHMGNRVVGGV